MSRNLAAASARRASSSPVKEVDIQRAILKALAAMRVWCWRAGSGTVVLGTVAAGTRRAFRANPAGTPDVLLVIDGRLCGLEVKSAKGRMQPSQVEWHTRAALNGVRVAVVRSVAEAIETVKQWRALT